MKILLIDDLRVFKPNALKTSDDVIVVSRNSAEALEELKTNTDVYRAIFLDHDLGVVETIGIDSIMPVVDFLCEQAFNNTPVNVETIYVHTSNPVGAKTMMAALQNYGYNAVRISASDYFTV